jgi:hypothetical protein
MEGVGVEDCDGFQEVKASSHHWEPLPYGDGSGHGDCHVLVEYINCFRCDTSVFRH